MHEPTGLGRLGGVLGHARRAAASVLSLAWLRELLVALALALAIITFLYQPVKVEGISMAPGLIDQERILVNKSIYHLEPIRRSDVIVFRFPRDPRKSFIKRVIGLPGETIEIRAGRVLINDVPLREDYLTPEQSDGVWYPRVTVPPGHYYALGDNRNISNDSRTWGTVPRAYIYGKAVLVYWPPEHWGSISSSNGKP